MASRKAVSRGLSERESRAVKEFCRLVGEKLGSGLKEVRLFGSKARGTSGPESDIDVLLITATKERSLEEMVIEAAVEVNLEYDVLITPLIISESRYYSPLYRQTLMFKTTRKRVSTCEYGPSQVAHGESGKDIRRQETPARRGILRWSVNRYYYAVSHAARALLATRGLDATKHKGVISLFNREFVKPGIVSKESSKTLTACFAKRSEADYDDFVVISHDEAGAVRVGVRSLIDEVARLVG